MKICHNSNPKNIKMKKINYLESIANQEILDYFEILPLQKNENQIL